MMLMAETTGEIMAPRLPLGDGDATFAPPSFEEVYSDQVRYVWSRARALGVGPEAIDDVVQEVFLVVHRRLSEFEGRASIRTWLTRILIRIVANHRRSKKRRTHQELPVTLEAAPESRPSRRAERNEAARLLTEILDCLDEDKRTVFVLAEVDEMTAKTIGETLGISPNTASSRLRLARRDFKRELARHHARDSWRLQ